jgi:hypothetical protein
MPYVPPNGDNAGILVPEAWMKLSTSKIGDD